MIPHRIGLNLLFLDERPLSGPGVYTCELVEQLVAAGMPDLELIGYIQPCAVKHFTPRAQAILRPLADLHGRGRRVLFEQFRLPVRARADRIDLLFSPAFVSPLWGAPRLVATIHDMYYKVVPTLISKGQRRYWSAMIPPSVRACDAVIAVSGNTGRDVERLIPQARGKVAVIPLASRFTRADRRTSPPADAGARYIVLVANVTANKNPSIVVDALSHVLASGREVRLIHVGNDEFGYLAAAARDRGVVGHVEQRGKISDAALCDLYANAVCTLVVSLYEGFGLPVLEAQALGSPLICSNRASLPEVAGDGAIMVDPTDAVAIGDQIARLLDDPDLGESLRTLGYANLERFSWERTATETAALFRRLLG